MTHDEHVARAMLLGRRYDVRVHMYVDWGNQTDRFLDADTMNKMDRAEFTRRLQKHFDLTNAKQAEVYRRACATTRTLEVGQIP